MNESRAIEYIDLTDDRKTNLKQSDISKWIEREFNNHDEESGGFDRFVALVVSWGDRWMFNFHDE